MPVSYIQPVPGWKASGKLAIRSTNSSAETSRCSGLPNTPRSIMAACRGVCSMTMPQPEVPASRSRTVIARSAGTVRSSGASGATSTRGSAASGSQRAMGSSSASTPSRTRVSVSAPPIGLVIDAMRNWVSSRMGGLPGATPVRPPARTCSCPRMRTAATYPGMRPASTWPSSNCQTRSTPMTVLSIRGAMRSSSSSFAWDPCGDHNSSV